MRPGAPAAGTPRGLVVASLEPWDAVWRRNQHLVSRLLRDDPELSVLWVEPAVDTAHTALREQRVTAGRGLRPGLALPGVADGRLWLLEPTKLLPRRLDPGFDVRRARRVAATAARLGMRDAVVWVNDPTCADLLDTLPGPALYDVTDDWLAADRPPAELARLGRAEATLLDRCAEVVVCSPGLAARKGRTRPVELVTNGVDLGPYEASPPRPADLPAGPVVLYAGTLHEDRLDVALTARLARDLTGAAHIVLVGPVALQAGSVATLESAGVVLLGARPHTEVPAYLRHADLLVVPHVVDAFTESLDPIKAYEYLAAGRPVVTTPVAGFRELPGRGATHVAVADADDFVAAAHAALATAPRRPLAAPAWLPTWDAQAALMAAVIERARRPVATPR